jgi:hypothetical protein
VPRIAGKIRRTRPVELRDAEFLIANTERRTKITIPGPFTMTQQAQNDFYPSDEAAAMDYADAGPGSTSSSSTSPTCRRAPRRPSNTRSRLSTARSRG